MSSQNIQDSSSCRRHYRTEPGHHANLLLSWSFCVPIYTRGVIQMAVKALSMFCVLAMAAGTGVAIKFIRYPQVDSPGNPDAFYTLLSSGGMTALKSHTDWLPPDKPLLVSVPDAAASLGTYQQLCSDPDLNVTCVTPTPFSTRGEARNLAKVAQERGWESVVVISQRSHMTRARILMERCFDGEVRMVPIDIQHGVGQWAQALIYESGAMVKAAILSEC